MLKFNHFIDNKFSIKFYMKEIESFSLGKFI